MTSATDTTSSTTTKRPGTKPIPPSAMPLIAPTTLLHAHLTQQRPVRPSGRTPDQTQPISLNIGSLTHCNGSSVVKIGHTTIICGVRAEILPVSEIPSYNTRRALPTRSTSAQTETGTGADDNDEKDTEAYDPIALYNLVVPNIDLSTGCSPRHAPNSPPSQSTQSLTQRLYSLLISTNLVSSHDLEIKYIPPADVNYNIDPDDPAYVADAEQEQVKAYWTLYVDLMCISHGGDGSVFDAAWLAVVAALKDVVLPRAWWDADEGKVLCSPIVEEGKSLRIREGIVPLSFGVFDLGQKPASSSTSEKGNGMVVLLDMDAFEEECCRERGCVVVDTKKNKVVRIEKNGGSLASAGQIKQVLHVAETRGHEWNKVLQSALGVARK